VALKSQRASKEANVQPRVRRLMREALIYWRRYEKVEREQRRKAEKEAVGQRKMDDEMREVGGCGHHGGVGDRYNDRDKEPDMLIEAV